MIFKCKMCGGALEVQSNATVAECEYCGTTQTLPRLDDERRANLYDRANHFRRNNEFDKAAGIYEQILTEDKTDAEAYWSLVLCRYGIEYVEDPVSHKRVPTVNRAQFTPVFADNDYKAALKCADAQQRAVYEAEAHAIDEIQKGILSISRKEEPFDIFICYKESDQYGRRTPDSVLAYELYQQLTREGFKVFFSRVTLEDKLGQEYEPYIFAALNSAKAMIVLGTRPEHFNAVWVKNEWSRYLALIRNGAKKTLIPAYKDMDPYDLPEEFSHLQAQDMGKLGAVQDIIRGIGKIIGSSAIAAPAAGTQIAPLLKRGFLFLEDSDWIRADECFEKALDADPESAEAYLGKLLTEWKLTGEEKLGEHEHPLEGNAFYEKALRYADGTLRDRLCGYNETVKVRLAAEAREKAYAEAMAAAAAAKTELQYRKAAEKLRALDGYKDSTEAALSAEAAAETQAEITRAQKRKTRKALGLSLLFVSVAALVVLLLIPGYFYMQGRLLLNKGEYENAIESYALAAEKNFTNGFFDADYMVEKGVYLVWGADSSAEERHEDAAAAYNKAGEFQLECESWYNAGKAYRAAEDYENAVRCFNEAFTYEDAKALVKETKLHWAQVCLDAGNYAKAFELGKELGSTAKDLTQTACYLYAREMEDAANYKAALDLYEKISKFGYEDSITREQSCRYYYACACLAAGDYENASIHFNNLGDYEDSKSKWQEATYAYANELFAAGSYSSASMKFNRLKDYLDSEALYTESRYQSACIALSERSFDSAANVFKTIVPYKDSQAKYLEAMYGYVKGHKNNTDRKTYEYLQELRRYNYEDSAAIYNSIYSWKAKLEYFNSSRNDTHTKASSTSRYCDYLHFSFKLSGGAPGESITVTHHMIWPSGSISHSNWHWEDRKSGDSVGAHWDDGLTYDGSGWLTIKIYNRNTGELIGEDKIKLT